MNKFLLVAISIFVGTQAFGFEDYLVIADSPVKSVSSSDSSVVSAMPFYTIDNEKNVILLKTFKEGKVVVTIRQQDGDRAINVDVKKGKTILSKEDGFTYFVLDVPDSLKGGEK